MMSLAVKIIKGVLEVLEPSNPFTQLFAETNEPNDSLVQMVWNVGGSD